MLYYQVLSLAMWICLIGGTAGLFMMMLGNFVETHKKFPNLRWLRYSGLGVTWSIMIQPYLWLFHLFFRYETAEEQKSEPTTMILEDGMTLTLNDPFEYRSGYVIQVPHSGMTTNESEKYFRATFTELYEHKQELDLAHRRIEQRWDLGVL